MTPHEWLRIEARDAYGRGDLPAAERACRQVLATAPLDVAATILLALVCARTGRRDAAIAYLRNAAQRDPDSLEAHAALSTLLFAAGDGANAIVHGRLTLELSGHDIHVYRHFVRGLISHGELEEAALVLRTAVERFPCDGAFSQDLAAVLSDLGRCDEAVRAWTDAVELRPDLTVGWLKLGGLHMAAMRFGEAVACAEKAVALAPDSADAHLLLALALAERGGIQAAEAQLRRTIELNPNEYLAHAALGLVLQEQGRFDLAEPHLVESYRLRPTHGLAYYMLLRGRKVTREDEPLLATIAGLIDHADAIPLDRANMHYALGKGREDLGEYEAAIGHYDEATRLAAQAWFGQTKTDQSWYGRMIGHTIAAFGEDEVAALKAQGLASDKPLFVVGMMRSGTTLVEQILSSHPDIAAGGELTYWHDHAPSVFDAGTREIDESRLFEVAKGYVALLDEVAAGARRVTDKMPHNYVMLGMVHSALPKARVIHVRRAPVDNCLSIYTTAYQRPPSFALNRENILYAYRQYQRVMAHWRSVLPPECLLDVEYEELVNDREGVTRHMIEFAGLEWSDACLNYAQNERAVNTPSVWQVRQPIYRTSVERWRRFEPWLGCFRELLDP